MTPAIALVGNDAAAQAKWDHYVGSHPDATMYHRREWQGIFGEAMGYPSFLLLASDAQGEPCGALPLYLVPSPWKRRLVAVPFRDRGGPLWDEPGALDALLVRACEIARAQSAGLVLKSLRPLPQAERHGFQRVEHWIHSTLELAGLDQEALWQRAGPKRRNMVRQAEQHGVEVHRATAEADAVQRWYALHLQTQKRLGVPPFPKRFFAEMLRALGPGVELLEARAGSDPCAAVLVFLHRDTCIYAYSASSAQGQRLRASDLLMRSALVLALERGLKRFDFGSDSPLQQNLLFFKRSWGAAQASIPLYATDARSAIRDSSQARYALGRAVLQRLPTRLLAAFGARLTPYLG